MTPVAMGIGEPGHGAEATLETFTGRHLGV